MRTTTCLLAAISLAASPPLASPLAAQPADTSKVSSSPLFTGKDLIFAGAFALGTAAAWPVDRYFAERLQNPRAQGNRFLRGSAAFFREFGVPGAFIIGPTLYAIGRLGGNERMADLGLHGTEAIVAASIVTGAIKFTAGRQRPFMDIETPYDFALFRGLRGGDTYRSFPSGHSAVSFAAAAAVVTESRKWWPDAQWAVASVMYGGATMVGISRMYNNKHWASDVLAGAAIGTFAGRKVVRYHHTHPGNKLDEWLLTGSISPAADGGYTLRWMILPR